MFKYSKDGISVLSVLDARRAKKSGLFPVKIQVIHNRKQKYYSTGKELSKEDWEILAESKSRRLIEIRASVENSFSIIKSQVEALAERGDFCFDALSMRLGRCTGTTLNTAIQGKIDAFKLNGQVNSYYNYRSTLKSIERFAGGSVPFSAVSADWLSRLDKFLRNEGKTVTTINFYMKALKCVVNDARRNGILKEAQYPFGRGKYEIPSGNSRKLALTMEQIKKGESIAVFIGPEGGFAPEEIALVQDEMQLTSLGKRILRTETAGIVALAILGYQLESSDMIE